MEKFVKELMDNSLEVLKKFNVFKGRSSRREFWLFIVAGVIVGIALAILSAIPFLGKIFSVVSYIFSFGLSLLSISVGIRRLHDVNKTGKLILPMLIGIIPMLIIQVIITFRVSRLKSNPLDYFYNPGLLNFSALYAVSGFFGFIALAGAIIVVVFCVKEGTPGENKYGPAPV